MSVASANFGARELVWVRPANSSLVALTAEQLPGESLWESLLADPAFFVHLLRFARPNLLPEAANFTSQLLNQPAVLLQAASFLKHSPALATLLPDVARTFKIARQIASQIAPENEARLAMALTQLPALGWLARNTVDEASEANPYHLAQQLLTRWRVPGWVSAIISGLPLLAKDAESLGAPPELFRLVQTALATAEARTQSLGLTTSTAEIASTTLAEVQDFASPAEPIISDDLLIRLLRQTAQARRASAALWLHEAEEREQKLLNTLALARQEFEDQVQQARLAGLAEFAAGASHEINNPLAVISGHAQLLLHCEADPTRQRQLETIIRQTHRIDDLLHGTRQFARPSRPKPCRFRVQDWSGELQALFHLDVEAKKLHWECNWTGEHFGFGDPIQLRQALIHLVRNAIEAAPSGGTVSIKLEQSAKGLRFVVEDSGPGPASEQVPYLFDPFFSGRSAGRGRGLGLSIAWRLADINGGSIRYVAKPNCPTRFVLEFPQSAAQAQPLSDRERRSA